MPYCVPAAYLWHEPESTKVEGDEEGSVNCGLAQY